MTSFRGSFQVQVLANAKALARALSEECLVMAGDPAIGSTATHLVVVEINYVRGVEAAQRLGGGPGAPHRTGRGHPFLDS